MKEIDSLYVSLLEWDRLQENLEINTITDAGPLHKGIKTISITRNADYDLYAEAIPQYDIYVPGKPVRIRQRLQ